MKEELLKGLSEEQIAKAKACSSNQELLDLAKEEGIELSKEQLAAVSGGLCSGYTYTCIDCGHDWKAKDMKKIYLEGSNGKVLFYICPNCGHYIPS